MSGPRAWRRRGKVSAGLCAGLLLLACGVWPARAESNAREQAEARLRAEVGPRLAAVKSTPSGLDDVALGEDLLYRARDAEQDPMDASVMRVAACKLLMHHPSGYADVAAALSGLQGDFEEDRRSIELQLLELYEQRYRRVASADRHEVGRAYLTILIDTADDRLRLDDFTAAMAYYRKAQSVARRLKPEAVEQIIARIRQVREQQMFFALRAELEGRLTEDAGDQPARTELAALLAREYDDLEQARRHAQRLDGAATRQALMDALNLSEPVDVDRALRAAEWWDQQYNRASSGAQPKVIQRVREAYERVLDMGDADDGSAVIKATLSLQLVRQCMDEFGLSYVPRYRNRRVLPHTVGLLQAYDLGRPLQRVALQPGGAWAVVASADRVLAWDIEEGAAVWQIRMPGTVTRLALSRDGRRLIIGGDAGDGLAVAGEWSLKSGKRVREPATMPGRLAAAGYTKGRPIVGVIGPPPSLWLLDAERLLTALDVSDVHHIAWPEDLTSVVVAASGESGQTLRRIDPLTGQSQRLFEGAARIAGLRVSDDGERVLALYPRRAQIFDASQGGEGSALPLGPVGSAVVGDDEQAEATGRPTAAALSRDGRRAAIAYEPGFSVVVYDTRSGSVVQQLEGHGAPVRGVTFSDDGLFLLTTSGSTLRVWGLPR